MAVEPEEITIEDYRKRLDEMREERGIRRPFDSSNPQYQNAINVLTEKAGQMQHLCEMFEIPYVLIAAKVGPEADSTKLVDMLYASSAPKNSRLPIIGLIKWIMSDVSGDNYRAVMDFASTKVRYADEMGEPLNQLPS